MLDRIRRFHRNERGDVAQVVIVAALIIIPLIMLVIAFSKDIGETLQDEYKKLTGAERAPVTISK